MPLWGRRELRVTSRPRLPCSTLRDLGQKLTFTPCSPGGPFTPAGQLVGHWKRNSAGFCVTGLPQANRAVLPKTSPPPAPGCTSLPQSLPVSQGPYRPKEPVSLPAPLKTTRPFPELAPPQAPPLTRKSALPSRP